MQLELSQRIKTHSKNNLLRERKVIDYHDGVYAFCGDKKLLVFSGNDYLGLARHPQLIAAMQEGVARYGVSGMASQMVVGHLSIHRQVEEAFAEFLGREAAILFSSGYMANLGVISALKRDYVVADKYVHASLIDAVHLSQAKLIRFKHGDYAHLAAKLAELDQTALVITESVYSMRGDLVDLIKCAAICKQYGATLLVDDAHGIGILGEEGGGCTEILGLRQTDLPILICPLAKAFAVMGAVVAGSKELIEGLLQFSRSYMYTNALPPALAYTALTSLALVKKEQGRRDKLRHLIEYFKQAAKQMSIPLLASDTPIQIILVGAARRAQILSEKLFERGFLLHAMRPPTVPANAACLRVSLSCLHSEKQIQELLISVKELNDNLS